MNRQVSIVAKLQQGTNYSLLPATSRDGVVFVCSDLVVGGPVSGVVQE